MALDKVQLLNATGVTPGSYVNPNLTVTVDGRITSISSDPTPGPTGPTGPTGPAGPTGPTGPTGPAGGASAGAVGTAMFGYNVISTGEPFICGGETTSGWKALSVAGIAYVSGGVTFGGTWYVHSCTGQDPDLLISGATAQRIA
jgi:hypothetical protein